MLEVSLNIKNEKNGDAFEAVDEINTITSDEIKKLDDNTKNDSEEYYSGENEEETIKEYQDSSEEDETLIDQNIDASTKKPNRTFQNVLNRINKSGSSFFEKIFNNKLHFILFISGILLLISLVISFCFCSNRKRYSIKYDDQNDNNEIYDENFTDSDTEILSKDMTDESYAKINFGSMVKNKIKKKDSTGSGFKYSKLNEGLNGSSKNKFLIVTSNEKNNNSFDSGISYLTEEHQQQYLIPNDNSINVKTNPFSFI